jgi:hypothetical protein
MLPLQNLSRGLMWGQIFTVWNSLSNSGKLFLAARHPHVIVILIILSYLTLQDIESWSVNIFIYPAAVTSSYSS